MSSNCQMVNIFAPFHQRINCRAAWGLRCTDHSDPDYPPLEPPHGGGRGAGGGSCNSYSPNHFPIKPSGPFGLHTPECGAAKTVALLPLLLLRGGSSRSRRTGKVGSDWMTFPGDFRKSRTKKHIQVLDSRETLTSDRPRSKAEGLWLPPRSSSFASLWTG